MQYDSSAVEGQGRVVHFALSLIKSARLYYGERLVVEHYSFPAMTWVAERPKKYGKELPLPSWRFFCLEHQLAEPYYPHVLFVVQ
jgi:hypothetical protein